MSNFTHFDKEGNAIMVDISSKEETIREATAIGTIKVSKECYKNIVDGNIKKGDVLQVARLAGIMGTKNTSNLIPLCHNILIEKVTIDFSLNESDSELQVLCTVKTSGKTGVEMEALIGANIALLTIYDMCKGIDKSIKILNLYLAKKIGGKSGTYEASAL